MHAVPREGCPQARLGLAHLRQRSVRARDGPGCGDAGGAERIDPGQRGLVARAARRGHPERRYRVVARTAMPAYGPSAARSASSARASPSRACAIPRSRSMRRPSQAARSCS